MSTNHFFKSDLISSLNITQNTLTLFPKELVIATLRNYFMKDSYYHFSQDAWGFPNTPDHTGLPTDAGLHNEATTRLFIGEPYRYDVIYYPALLIRNSGSASVPISFNRERGSVKYEELKIADGYGNLKTFRTPQSFIYAGAWEGSMTIDILTRSLRARDDLVELVALIFTDMAFDDLAKSGIVVKRVSIGSPSESDDRNDKLFKQTITLEIRTEWRREIPITNVVEVINFSMAIANIEDPTQPTPLNIEIDTADTLLDIMSGI